MSAFEVIAVAAAALVIIGMVAMTVPHIREVREERIRAKAIDEFHDTRARTAEREREVAGERVRHS